MNDEFYFFIGFSVIAIEGLKHELLIREESYRFILWASVGLFILGLALHFNEVARHSSVGALLCPLPSVLLFRLYRRVFLRRMNREPKDVTLNFKTGLFWDRVFSFAFFFSATFLLFALIIGMEKLAKAGL